MQLWSRGSLPPDGLVLSSHRNPHVTQQATDSFASSEAAGQAPYVEVNYVEPPEEPGLQAQAAAWYAQTYGVTLDEATRRLEFQDDVSLIVEDVVNALGPDYAGMWFDAVDGGRLKIGVATTASEPSGPGVDEAKAILSAGGLLGRSDFLSKESSVNSLSAALPGLEDRLASLLAVGKVSIGMRARLNALVISVANDLSTAEVAEVSDAAAQTPVATRVLSTGEPSGGAVFEACSRGGAVPATLYCDRPLRGGVRITSPDARACTSGFMAKDRDDPDKRYVLTAGHCLSQGAEWMTRNVSGEQFLIGSRVAGWENGPDADAGLINVPANSHFSEGSGPAPWVVVDSSEDTEYNQTYPIRGTGLSKEGRVLCRTSGFRFPSGNWTACGEILELGHTEVFQSDGRLVRVRNLGVASICGSVPGPGASGGPYYKRGRAYGIHVGARQVSPCIVFYQGIRGAEDAMGVDILRAR